MFELFLDAVKVVVSKDARESASALVNLFNSSPEWQNDICTIDAKISSDAKERAFLIGSIIEKKLITLGYDQSIVMNYGYTYKELSYNAFEHGTKNTKAPIRILTDITSDYIATSFYNAKGVEFNFDVTLYKDRIFRNTGIRGRGIISSFEKADEMMSTKGNGIKFVFYKDFININSEYLSAEQVAIIINNGHGNPALGEKLINKINDIKDEKKIDSFVIFFDPTIYMNAVNSAKNARIDRNKEYVEKYGYGPTTGICSSLLQYISDTSLQELKVIHSDKELQKFLPNDIFSLQYEKSWIKNPSL